MYGDTKTAKHRKLIKGSASSKNIMGRMSNERHEEIKKNAMGKAILTERVHKGKAFHKSPTLAKMYSEVLKLKSK